MRFGSAKIRPPSRLSGAAFTLIEVLVASAVFLLILGLTLVLVSNLTRLTSRGGSSIAAFQEARTAFETMNRLISQAVLNTYLDYNDPANPQHYLRASELHFVLGPAPALTGLASTEGTAVFFQAPISRSNLPTWQAQTGLLNALGFYVRHSTLPDLPPFLAGQQDSTAAWRLWMFLQPAENFQVYETYNAAPQAGSDFTWFRDGLGDASHQHILANNILLLLIRASYEIQNPGQPELAQWESVYAYDSRGSTSLTPPQSPQTHQLPPVLNITMVAIDESTAAALREAATDDYRLIPGPPLFTEAANYAEDMNTLTQHLDSRPLAGVPIHYRVFETSVSLTSAKWSR